MNRFSLTLLLLLVTAIWGWTFTMVKEAVEAYGVVGFLAIRFLIGSLSLGPVAVRGLTWKTAALGGAIGAVLAAAFLLQTFGLRFTTATNCGLITGLYVISALLLNRALFGVRLRRLVWAAVGLSVLGLFLLTGAGPARPHLGDGLTLGAAICFGLQIVLLDRYAKGHAVLALTLSQLVAVATILLLVWPAVEPLAWPPPSVWWALVITGVLATAVGITIQVLVQQHLPAVRAAMLFTLEPVFAALFGYLLAGDRLTTIQIGGAALMVAAAMASEVGLAWQKTRA
ncbi:MAG: DMT family transporter [Planctomycetota bacterium]|nr:DMT family transporter [Planctomycetota bacterium]